MFLIGAFIIAASLIVLKLNMKAPSIEEQLRLIDATMENSIASNLMTEIENSAKFSVDQKTSINNDVFDFANFTERKAGEHGLEFLFLFVGSYANVSNSYLNVSVINMLNGPISVTLNLNDGSSAQTNDMIDNTKWDTNFTFTPGTNYNLTVSYNSTYTQNVTIKTKNNKDIYVSFFDITLQTSNAVYTNKTQDTYKLK
jgi:hypothetical protein